MLGPEMKTPQKEPELISEPINTSQILQIINVSYDTFILQSKMQLHKDFT